MKQLAHKLVLNEEPKKQPIQNLVLNLLPKLVRHDKMENRDFLVVPMVILTEGVHAGSDGPMLYPKEELSKTPVTWNHKPVVVYHPEMNGVGISACDPSVITNRKVGVMMNTKFEKGKLKSEAWIEVDRANTVDERIMAAIEANTMMELSTGVFVDCEETPGEWKGEAYSGIARNYRPDHLALLPDKIGACSIKDGAGFLRNQQEEVSLVRSVFAQVMRGLGVTENELSHSNIADSLREALRKKFNVTDNMAGPFLWVNDVYTDFVIYELGGKLFRLGYSATDTGVTLDKEAPAEVKRVTEYRTVEGAFVGNQDPNQNQTKKIKIMNKKELVDSIITSNIGWKEEDRTALMELTEKQLEAVRNLHKEMPTVNFKMVEKDADGKVTITVVKNAPTAPPSPKKGEAKADYMARCTNMADKAACAAMFDKMMTKNEEEAGKSAPVAPRVLNLQEYIQAAPPEVQNVLNNSLSVYEEEKNKLVDSIIANKNNPFTKEDLSNRPLGELRSLARLAGVTSSISRPPANYAGQGAVPSDNAESEEALSIPAMSFAK